MDSNRTTIAVNQAKDAALYCTYLLPVSICWELDPGERFKTNELLESLLPRQLQKDRELLRLFICCIDARDGARVSFLVDGVKYMFEKQKDRVLALSLLVGRLIQGGEVEFSFFGPCDSSREGFEQDSFVTSLSGIELIDSTRISWDEIIAIRKDPEARVKLRQLKFLFESNFAGKPRSYIEDDILRRIDDYRSVVKEYKFETKLVVFEQILTSKSLGVLGSATLVSAIAGAPMVAGGAVLAGAAIELGKACVAVAKLKRRLDQEVRSLSVGYLIGVQDRLAAPKTYLGGNGVAP